MLAVQLADLAQQQGQAIATARAALADLDTWKAAQDLQLARARLVTVLRVVVARRAEADAEARCQAFLAEQRALLVQTQQIVERLERGA